MQKLKSGKIVRLGIFALVVAGATAWFLSPSVRSSVLASFDPAPVVDPLQLTVTLDKQLVGSGFDQPLFIANANDGTNRLFVVERPGTIHILKDKKPIQPAFLDIQSIVGSDSQERGLLSVAFHPKFKDNGLFFVYYTDRNGDTVVAQYSVSKTDPNQADPLSAKLILFEKQPFPNHNGGQLQFGPDGYLYIGLGDGGAAADPFGNGQNLETILGKILRIDIDHSDNNGNPSGIPYAIPTDNPFVKDEKARHEIWAYGLRNPWRFSFDRATGDMYIGDVGQNTYEEISYWKAGTPIGLNYGWRTMEGFHCFPDAVTCDKTGLVLPIMEYSHKVGNSVSGGYVYNGTAIPELKGTYLYADFGVGKIWALKQNANGKWENALALTTDVAVSSFGEDESGELYFCDFGNGAIYKIASK